MRTYFIGVTALAIASVLLVDVIVVIAVDADSSPAHVAVTEPIQHSSRYQQEESPDKATPSPDDGPTMVAMGRGESLAEVAENHGVEDWRRIFNANPHVKNPHRVYPGQEIRIPDDSEALATRHWSQPPKELPSEETSSSEQEHTQPASPPFNPQPAPRNTVWDRLARCESGGNWHTNTGNGFYGGLQFHPDTWVRYGGREFASMAHLATRGQEIIIAERVLASEGWGAWPACSHKLGLR